MRHLSSRAVTKMLIAANAILLITLTLQIGERFLYEVSGAFNGDSPIYWAVGRGLVNGLTLYGDMFDIKPPGIFLVSALSYAMSGTMRLGHIIQGLVIALLPLTMVIPVVIDQRKDTVHKRLFGLLLALGFMGAVTMYVAREGGEFQTESFGLLFVCGYVGTAILLRHRESIFLTVIAGILFYGGILFKEPFLIASIVAGLLLCKSVRDIVRIVILPCTIGLIMLGLTFLFMGALHDYITIYLPFMTGNRTLRFGSPFSRAMMIEGIIIDMWRFSPFLALGIGLLWLYSLTQRAEINVRSLRSVLIATLFIVGLIMLNYGLQSVRLFSWTHRIWTMRQSPPWIIAGLSVASVSGYMLYRSAGRSRTMLIRTALLIFAVIAAGYITGLSGEFLGHHMLFAIPIYMALAYEYIETTMLRDRFLTPASIVLSALLVLAVFLHGVTDYEKRRDVWTNEATSDKALAAYIDNVLDACNISQYLIVGETQTNVFGYTKHSPLGPIFFQHSLIRSYPQFTLAYVHQIWRADVLLTSRIAGRESIPGLAAYVQNDFTDIPPTCAAPYKEPTGKLHLLFRERHTKIDLNVTADGQASIAFNPEDTVESQ